MTVIRHGRTAAITVPNIAARDAILNPADGLEVVVSDAAGDPHTTGRAVYKYIQANNSWVLLTDKAGDVNWSGIWQANKDYYQYSQIKDDRNLYLVLGDYRSGNVSANADMLAGHLLILGTVFETGWKDLLCPFMIKGSGSQDPTYGALWDGFKGYLWHESTVNEAMCDFHIGHDIAQGTKVYPHVHWTPMTVAAGTVRWGFEFSVAKGHNQGEASRFPTSTTVYVEHTFGVNSSRLHFITETPDALAIPSTNIEPDSFVKLRVFRDASHVNDTYGGKIHAWQADLHYQAERSTTKNKAPNFYV